MGWVGCAAGRRSSCLSHCVLNSLTLDTHQHHLPPRDTHQQIDVEWVNGPPGAPNAVWLNSFNRGVSGGERLITREQYAPALKLPPGAHAGSAALTYTIDWQPGHVAWFINGRRAQRRSYGQRVEWTDMKGETVSPSKRTLNRTPADAP